MRYAIDSSEADATRAWSLAPKIQQPTELREENEMHAPIQISLIAGLSIAGVGAAAAESDPNVWRFYVGAALRAQEEAAAPRLYEGRASAVEPNGFRQRYERYFADGAPAPSESRLR
jgi:hypothetical protein